MDAQYLHFYFFLLLANTSILALRVYVKPNENVTCPGDIEPCITLTRYAKEPKRYFSVNNTSFVFLPGTHKLNATVNVVNVSNFSLVSYHAENDTAYIIVSASDSITWRFCDNVTILGLTFIVHGDTVLLASRSPGLSFISTTAFITYLTVHQTRRVGSLVIVFSEMVIDHLLIDGNMSGNAILVWSSTVDFIGESIFSNIVAFRIGGAMWFANCNVTFSGKVLFLNNVVKCIYDAVGGGAITMATSTVYFKGSAHFYNNSAVTNSSSYCVGGAMLAVDSAIVFDLSSDLVFAHNVASIGGAVYMYNSSLRMEGNVGFHSKFASNSGVVFLGNNVSLAGGAFLAESSTVELVNVSFERNRAKICGGALAITLHQEKRNFHIISCNFSNNYAPSGGAVAILGTHDPLIGSGAFFVESSTVELVNVSFERNRANYSGGALTIFQQEKRNNFEFHIISCNFSNNSAPSGGAVAILGTHDPIIGSGNSFKYTIITLQSVVVQFSQCVLV